MTQCSHTFKDAHNTVHQCRLEEDHDGDGIYDGHVYTKGERNIRWVEDDTRKVIAVGVEGVTACTTVMRQNIAGKLDIPKHFLRNRGRDLTDGGK